MSTDVQLPAQKKMKTESGEAKDLAPQPSLTYRISERLLRLLISTKVDIVRPPDNKIFVCQRTDKVTDVWKGLAAHNFLSVPVLQKTKNKYYGFLDIYDIVKFTVDTFGDIEALKSSEDWTKAANQSEAFSKQTVNDVMRYPLTKKNPFHPLLKGYSLFAAIEIMARESGVHRIPVVDEERKLVTVVTQSQIVQILEKNLDIMGELKNKPVMLTDRYIEEVYSVQEDTIALDAFKLMVEKKVSGLAVVDKEGKLTGNISLKDLKALSTDERLFWRLYQTVHNFLLKIRKENNETGGDRPRKLVCVKERDTIEDVIRRLNENKIHRIYIVDALHKPAGVISLKDVLAEIVS